MTGMTGSLQTYMRRKEKGQRAECVWEGKERTCHTRHRWGGREATPVRSCPSPPEGWKSIVPTAEGVKSIDKCIPPISASARPVCQFQGSSIGSPEQGESDRTLAST